MKHLLAIALLVLTTNAWASNTRLPTDSPLQHVKAKFFDEVAATPKWSPKGKSLYIQVAGVHFNEYWREAVSKDLAPGFEQAIENNFSIIFKQVLTEQYTKEGYQIESSAINADVILLASVEDLRVYVTQAKHFVESKTANTGSANLLIEFIEKGELKMFFSNAKETRQRGNELRNSVEKDFERMMKAFTKESLKVIKKR